QYAGAQLLLASVVEQLAVSAQPRRPDVCLLAKNSGGCRKPSVLWYHDARTGRCALFLYNGCGGNQNRFRTRERCSGRVPVRVGSSDVVCP
uniref:BPTI/Kunitz inhibitor domain-containing protein n=1 Tax=Xiphophorus couchianus TaxID=32473 RepID=A0A3B5MTX3_9TELE